MAAAVFLAVSGGIRTTVGGLRVSARSPVPIAILALVAVSAWFAAARRHGAVSSDLDEVWTWLERHATASLLVIALASSGVAAAFATRSAAGADASGYVSQAGMWTRGEWQGRPVAPPLDGWIGTPLGWRPAAKSRQVPTYPPGLPLLMAIPHAIAGIDGASAVVVVSAGVAVAATGFIAVSLGGPIAGMLAAALIGFLPVFIYQGIQPMSDVPVTAAWMVCFALLMRGGSLDGLAGLACALAVLIRPNLAPLAIVPLWLSNRRAAFAVPVAIAGVFLATMQAIWYGSPLQSGYGSADELFALSNIGANAGRYARWFVATAPALVLALFAMNRIRRDRRALAIAVFAALVLAAYLIYAVFDDWSYLRFLLPALAVLAVLAAVELAAWLARWPGRIAAPLCFALTIGLPAHGLFVARSLDTFKLAGQLERVAVVAGVVGAAAPAQAAILSGEQSGSMRYYTDRSIIRWEAATADQLASTLAALEQSGRPVFIVLDAWEEPLFKTKFALLPAAALDWPPMLEAGSSHRTRLWRLSDRERFLKGESLDIKRVP